MNITDIRTRVDALNQRSHLVTRSLEPEDPSVLTLVDTAGQNEDQSCEKLDPLIQALVDKLPKPGTNWLIEDRAKWLKAAALIFNLLYQSGEGESGLMQKPEKTGGLPSVLSAAG